MDIERLKFLRDSASAKVWPSKVPELNVELMSDWSEEDARHYFESGGLFFPASRGADGSRVRADWRTKGGGGGNDDAVPSADGIANGIGDTSRSRNGVPSSTASGGAAAAAATEVPQAQARADAPGRADDPDADKIRVILIPDHPEETWPAALKEELDAEGRVVCHIRDNVAVNRLLDEKKQKTEMPKLFGPNPERTIIVGRTDGADTALYHLEQRKLGGAVLFDFKNRGSFLWAIVRKNAGPRGGNLALVNSEPPKGSRYAERYATKLGVEVIGAEQLGWAMRAAIRGVDGREPRKVRILGLTLGLTSAVYAKWRDKLPKEAELVSVHVDHLLPRFTAQRFGAGGLAEMGAALADELIRSKPPRLDRPSMIVAHDVGAWLAYELLVSLERRRAEEGDAAGWQMPSVLIASSMRPPHMHDPKRHEPDTRHPFIAHLPTEPFFKAFKRRFGLPPALQDDPEMQAVFEPSLRHVMRLVEAYRPSPGWLGRAVGDSITPLALRVVACGARYDERQLHGQLEGWAGYAGAAPLAPAAAAGLAGHFAGAETDAFAWTEFDMYNERIKKANAERDAASGAERTIRVEATNFLRLTYKPPSNDPKDFMTGEPHRYIIETPEPIIALVAAEAALLGLR